MKKSEVFKIRLGRIPLSKPSIRVFKENKKRLNLHIPKISELELFKPAAFDLFKNWNRIQETTECLIEIFKADVDKKSIFNVNNLSIRIMSQIGFSCLEKAAFEFGEGLKDTTLQIFEMVIHWILVGYLELLFSLILHFRNVYF